MDSVTRILSDLDGDDRSKLLCCIVRITGEEAMAANNGQPVSRVSQLELSGFFTLCSPALVTITTGSTTMALGVHNIYFLSCKKINFPVGRLGGSTESFVMERGVRQYPKEGPLLFNITFQLVLEELQADAKELFSGDAKGWLAKPCSKIPENVQDKPNLVGSRPQIIKCSNPNCSRWFARRAEMLRHVRQNHGAVDKPERAKLSCPVTDCHKQYKVRGWLNKHLQSCHPEVTSTVSGKRERSSRAKTPLPPARRDKVFGKFACNFPTAALPTNHPSSREKLAASTEMPHPFSTVFIP
ncbi:hypothetical protein ACTXT7_011063 [Hymenolepis weldensis]